MRRRVWRITGAAGAGLSFALLVLAVGMWWRSHARGDWLKYRGEYRLLDVLSLDGCVRVAWGRPADGRPQPHEGWEGSIWPMHRRWGQVTTDLGYGTFFGFGYQRWGQPPPILTWDAHVVTVPHGSLMAALAVWPGLAGTRGWRWWRVRRQRMAGACAACGYDLRGSTSGMCSECGARAPQRERSMCA